MSELHTIRQRDARIAERILFLLERKGMTQEQLLEKAKILKDDFQSILDGFFERKIVLVMIANALGANLDWILYGNDIYSNIPNKIANKKVAVFDGSGESTTVGLYYEYLGEDRENEEIPWPSDWPNKVDRQFLTEKGFICINA